jgi:hypothetical protein
LGDVEDPTFSRHSDRDGVEVVSLMRGLSLPPPPSRFLVLTSVSGSVNPRTIVGLEGLEKLKNPITSLKFELATFRLVA